MAESGKGAPPFVHGRRHLPQLTEALLGPIWLTVGFQKTLTQGVVKDEKRIMTFVMSGLKGGGGPESGETLHFCVHITTFSN